MIENSTFIYILNSQTTEESIFFETDFLDIEVETEIGVCLPNLEVPNHVNEKVLSYLYSK